MKINKLYDELRAEFDKVVRSGKFARLGRRIMDMPIQEIASDGRVRIGGRWWDPIIPREGEEPYLIEELESELVRDPGIISAEVVGQALPGFWNAKFISKSGCYNARVWIVRHGPKLRRPVATVGVPRGTEFPAEFGDPKELTASGGLRDN